MYKGQPDNLEIVSQVMTLNDVDDAETGVEIISHIKENIKSCAGDGAYDKTKFRTSNKTIDTAIVKYSSIKYKFSNKFLD